jgi:hypothetical protein
VATGIATTATVSLAFAGYARLFVPFPLWMIAAAPTVLGLLVVLLVLTRFESRAYSMAAVLLAIAFAVQAIPWRQAAARSHSPACGGAAQSETRR